MKTAEEIRDIVQRVLDQAKHQSHCEVVFDSRDICVIGIYDSVLLGDLQRIAQETQDPYILVDQALYSDSNIELLINKRN